MGFQLQSCPFDLHWAIEMVKELTKRSRVSMRAIALGYMMQRSSEVSLLMCPNGSLRTRSRRTGSEWKYWSKEEQVIRHIPNCSHIQCLKTQKIWIGSLCILDHIQIGCLFKSSPNCKLNQPWIEVLCILHLSDCILKILKVLIAITHPFYIEVHCWRNL